jgi:site-specific DNA-methyltransferase (adenine-specific)/adenine-specific DNA-methyltransferase
MGRGARPNQFFPITNPRTGKVYQPNPERVWRFYPQSMQEVILQGLVIWPDDCPERRMERPRYKTYYDPNTAKPKPVSSWVEATSASSDASEEAGEQGLTVLSSGMNQEGGRALMEILGTKVFAYPKPTSLIASLVQAATRPGDLVLDSFAGSGTTGHAVLKLNAESASQVGAAPAESGQPGLPGLAPVSAAAPAPRRFILVEMEPQIARGVTAERVRRVAQGYSNAKGEAVAGLGGGFRFCELGEPLFDESGAIRETVSFADLARHVYFSETGEPLPRESVPDSPLLGVCRGVAIYLLYNGILGDASVNGGNVLTRGILASLPPFAGTKVIYCAGCRLGEDRLQAERIIVRQTPYEVRVS